MVLRNSPSRGPGKITPTKQKPTIEFIDFSIKSLKQLIVVMFSFTFMSASYADGWQIYTHACANNDNFSTLIEQCIAASTNNICRLSKVPHINPNATCELPDFIPRTRLERWEGTSPSNNGHSTNNTCSPINIATGNKFFRSDDYQDGNFELSRFYNSTNQRWEFNYRQSLVISNNYINAFRPDGSVVSFLFDGSNYSPGSERKEELIFENNTYQLRINNITEEYNAEGSLINVYELGDTPIQVNQNGILITLTKDIYTTEIELDNLDRIIRITNTDNYQLQYEYTELTGFYSVLTGVTLVNPLGEQITIRQYLYEDSRFPTYITGIIDENGNRISSVVYDDQGRAISSEKGPLGSGTERTQIQYNTDGTRTVTSALGKQTTYHFTQFNGEYKITQVEGHASANCAAANQAYTYDANGFMASSTDWQGNVTTYVHNDRGQETSRTEASGTPQARTITTEWHADFNLPTRIVEPERETLITYDSNGRMTSREIIPGL